MANFADKITNNKVGKAIFWADKQSHYNIKTTVLALGLVASGALFTLYMMDLLTDKVKLFDPKKIENANEILLGLTIATAALLAIFISIAVVRIMTAVAKTNIARGQIGGSSEGEDISEDKAQLISTVETGDTSKTKDYLDNGKLTFSGKVKYATFATLTPVAVCEKIIG